MTSWCTCRPWSFPAPVRIATTGGATNIVEVRSDSLGKSCLVGQGAGALPTANSVMSDFLAVIEGGNLPTCSAVHHQQAARPCAWPTTTTPPFYIRIRVDALGIIRAVGEVCEKWGVSIHAVLQIPIVDVNNVRFVIRTERAKLSQVRGVVSMSPTSPFASKKPFFHIPAVRVSVQLMGVGAVCWCAKHMQVQLFAIHI